jgi:hypothetical protein
VLDDVAVLRANDVVHPSVEQDLAIHPAHCRRDG